jgi:hypothetical protein
MASTDINHARQDEVRQESSLPGGDLSTKTSKAIAREVAYRRARGLPIAVDRGNGVEYLPQEETRS